MKNRIWVVGCLALALAAHVAVKAEPSGVPGVDKAEVAKQAEFKGDLARAHQNYWTAASLYRDAVKADPKDARLQNKLGMVYLLANDRSSAHKAFKQAAKLNPQYVDALNNLGAVAIIDKKYNSALHYLKQALALDESNASAHLNMAETWIGLGQIDRGMTEYARALELNADILSSSGNGVLLQISTPEQRGRVDFLIAKSLARRGNLEGALEYLERAKECHYSQLAKVYEDEVFTPLWTDIRLTKIVKRPS